MYVDVMVSDASKPVWREAALFDAIITDRKFILNRPLSTLAEYDSFLKVFPAAVLQQACATATSLKSSCNATLFFLIVIPM